MKKKLFILPLIALSVVSVAVSCAPNTSEDSSHSQSTDFGPNDGRHHIADLKGGNYDEGLMIYDNPSTPTKPYSGGGLNGQYKNAKDEELLYDYHMLGKNHYYNRLTYMQSTGDLNLLVIPVKFADYDKNATESVRERIYNAYFGTEEETGYESVATYFEKSSYGALNINGVVTDWYECDWGTNIYGFKETAQLANEAFDWYKTKYKDNGSKFDIDKDGYVDTICLIYNAPVYESNNDNLWAYCYWVQPNRPGTVDNPIPNTFFFASMSFMTPRDKERRDPIKIDTHTYIHELGHTMGIDDYYSYERRVDDKHRDYRPGSTGGFIMEDMNVGDHDPFTKLSYGWTKPTVVTGSTEITLSSFEESGEVLIFKPENSMNSPFDEYIAVDLYTPTGLNAQDSKYLVQPGYVKGPRVPGIRVWHVDARLLELGLLDNEPNKNRVTTIIDPGKFCYRLAMSNTATADHGSPIPEFRKYKLLHLIQKGGVNTYEEGQLMTKNDLFMEGDTFSMDAYKNFFVNNGRFNSNKELNVSIKVKSINGNKAVLDITM